MSRKTRKRSLFFGITSRTLMTISAGLLLVSFFSMFVNPAKAWFMTIFGLLFFPLLLCNLFLLCWAIFRRSSAAFIPLLALMPAAFMFGKFFQFRSSEQDCGDGVKIVSYNVGRFTSPNEALRANKTACADSVMAFLKNEDADIICLQEFYMKNPDRVKTYLESRMKGYDIEYFVNVDSRGCYGNVTLSRYPALGKGKIDFDHSSNLALYSDYMIGGERFRVYNCHFESYNISLSRLAASLEKDYHRTVLATEEKMKKSIVRRPKQVEQVMRNIESCNDNVIVTGDFNDTPMSYTYWRLSRKRKDSFVDAGWGTGATFFNLRPFLRIDYVLFPETYKAVSHKVIHKDFSDHYPIVAKIKKREELL